MTSQIKYGFLFCALVGLGCKKFVQVDPPNYTITAQTAFQSDASAASTMTGVYEQFAQTNSNTNGGTLLSMSLIGGLVADELKNYYASSSALSQCYTNSMQSSTTYFWPSIYKLNYMVNAVLAGLPSSLGVSQAENQQLMGEAFFMRAFLHFYATNLFGNVPIVTTTNYLTNNAITRSPSSEVYKQIIQDLTQAENLLPANFVTPTGQTVTTERVRPTKWAAAALLARTYLYTGNWDSAATQATMVINNTSLFSLVTPLNTVFKKNSSEAVWQLQPVSTGYNTYDAYNFILTSAPGTSRFPVAVSTNLYNAFEVGDVRQTGWIGKFTSAGKTYYYPFKYQTSTTSSNTAAIVEYTMVLRLAEQYLIRAEAEAQMNNLQDATTDLNTIRTRAGLPGTAAISQSDLLTAIYHERQVELFTEWGHRWFDLKRLNLVNTVMGNPGNVTGNKGGTWSPDWALFPVPLTELTANANLGQNQGY